MDHRITADLLATAARLKWVFVPFTGVNTLPWELLNEREVQVSNNHGNATIVAEFDRGMRLGHWFRRDEIGFRRRAPRDTPQPPLSRLGLRPER